ncbi:MAG: tandem-95 repeat protein, partial [Mesotoga sp.]|nr:tandem-95 repeat protein [Mesotoga sp.]
VIRVNRPPEIDTSPVVVQEGEMLSIDLNSIATDPDGDELEFSVEGPGKLEGSIYSYAPGYSDSGKAVLRVLARDTQGNETARDIQLEVTDVNAPPEVRVNDQIVNEGERLTVDIISSVTDEDVEKIILSIEDGPGRLEDGLFIYEPSFEDAGKKIVSIKAADSFGNETFSSFEIEIHDVNRPPRLLLSDLVMKEGETVEVDILSRVSEPDGDDVQLRIEGPGEIVDGTYRLSADFGDAGDKSVKVFLEDEKGATNTTAFTVRVEEVNRSPVVSIPDGVVKEGETLRFYLRGFASDPDGDELTFEVSEGPGTVEDGNYIFTPDFDSEGSHEVELLVTDNEGAQSIGIFTVTVENVNRPPLKILPSLSTTIMETFTLSLDLKSLFTDPDGDELSYEVEGFGSILNNSYSCSPGYGDQGEKAATVTASDPFGLSDSMLIKIDVRDKNRDPELSISDMTTSIREGFTLKIDLVTLFSDPDDDELVFSITGPGEIEEGYYSYSPDFSEAGEKSIVISATDSKGGSTSLPIHISVVDVNRAPVVSIPDGVVKEGETLRLYLRGFASDPDGDKLTFEVSEGPGTIEDSNYIFTPDFDSEGSHEVELLVTDNKGTESIDTFTVTVENTNRPPNAFIPDGTAKTGSEYSLYLRGFAGDPDGDKVAFKLVSGPGEIVDDRYLFLPERTDIGHKEIVLEISDEKGMKTETAFTLTVEANEKIVRISYGLPSFDGQSIKIVAGPNEIFSTGKQAVIETDWIFDFEEIHFYEIEGSQETLIGTAEIGESSDDLNRKIYSPSGTYVGNIILLTN